MDHSNLPVLRPVAETQGALSRPRAWEGALRMRLVLGLAAAILCRAETAQEIHRRGEVLFAQGDVEGAVRAFDQAVTLAPALKPYSWQRGIALYYAGRRDDCRAQFELHATVNREDVENSAWLYLCSGGKQYLPVTRDSRVPMNEVNALYLGRGTPEALLARAQDSLAQFYAALYLALWYEARGDCAGAKQWITKAAAASAGADYMGAVARVHARRLPCRPAR